MRIQVLFKNASTLTVDCSQYEVFKDGANIRTVRFYDANPNVSYVNGSEIIAIIKGETPV